ncbi:transposase, partial [Hymenobacter lapidarius]|uniref:transposase n=1 Tax=Hymenobacter lapidarius TaxID=1908237 RepID=UPI0018737B9D
EQGLTFCFLPPYSPELNKIERLWRHCKQYWLTPADYVCDRTLAERVAYVLKHVGTEYTIIFG